MGRMWIAGVMVTLALGGTAQAKGARRGGGGRIKHARYDPTLDFSKHFDDEVKWEREHPRPQESAPPRHPKRGQERPSGEPPSNE